MIFNVSFQHVKRPSWETGGVKYPILSASCALWRPQACLRWGLQHDLSRAADGRAAERRRHHARRRSAAALSAGDGHRRYGRRECAQSILIFWLGRQRLRPRRAANLAGSREVEPSGGGYTLNFENAPISQVAKSVLGDILGLGYVIDPRAQGSISLSSGRPIEKKDMLFVLENALSANNLVMVRNASGYRIAPANDGGVGAVDEARAGSDSAEPGFGLTVIPLQYVSGTTLTKLLEGFATRPGAIRTDPSGKLLIVVGTGSERQSAVETVRSFDVDWLRGQSVGMYPCKTARPSRSSANSRRSWTSGDSGLGHGLVKFQPVSRLNSILVVASKPELLRAAARWISRLDEPSTSSASVKVYKVRYGDAKQIAQLLQQIFVTNGGAGSAESATNEIAPGSGVKAMTAAERLTGGCQA